MRMDKQAKIFISHSSKDEKYAQTLVELLEKIGISSKFIFCTSVSQYDAELTKNFIEKIME